MAARAEQPATIKPSQTAPLPVAPLWSDSKAFAFAAPEPTFTFAKFDAEKFYREKPQLQIDRVDLGATTLRFDTSRNPVDFVPRAVTDAPDLSDVIVAPRFGKKRGSRPMQNYLGLTFITPTLQD